MKKVVYGVLLIAVFGLTACGNDKKETSSSSKVEQSTSSSTKESSTSTSSSIVESSSETSQSVATLQETQQPESEVAVEEAVPSSEEQPVENNDPVYVEVLNGEGPRQFAERNGITLEQLYEINGIPSNLTNWAINGGQSLRIK